MRESLMSWRLPRVLQQNLLRSPSGEVAVSFIKHPSPELRLIKSVNKVAIILTMTLLGLGFFHNQFDLTILSELAQATEQVIWADLDDISHWADGKRKTQKLRLANCDQSGIKDVKQNSKLAASFGIGCRLMDTAAVPHSAISISASRAAVSKAAARAYSPLDT